MNNSASKSITDYKCIEYAWTTEQSSALNICEPPSCYFPFPYVRVPQLTHLKQLTHLTHLTQLKHLSQLKQLKQLTQFTKRHAQHTVCGFHTYISRPCVLTAPSYTHTHKLTHSYTHTHTHTHFTFSH